MFNKAINAASHIVILVILGLTVIHAQTTEFSYQGALKTNGVPANGIYDFEFALFDALSGGSQLGATMTRSSVAVANGIFSVQLDFGSEFPGANRFLEIRVRQTGGGAFTPLAPRQLVTSSPYSVKSLSADTAASAASAANAAQLGGVAASQYVVTNDPRMTDARPPTAGSSNYIQNTTSPQTASHFNISGNGTAAGMLSGSIVNATTQFNIGGSRILSNAGVSNLFAGVGAGLANTGQNNAFFGSNSGFLNTTGFGNAFFGSFAGNLNTVGSENAFFGGHAGYQNTTGTGNAFFGSFAGQSNTTGASNAFFGPHAGSANATGGNNTFVGAFAGWANTSASSNTFVGAGAGYLNTGSGNAFFGSDAGRSNNSANNNTFVGAGAGYLNTSGGNNAFFGSSAGLSNMTASNNAFFGSFAGNLNTTGASNSFFGSNAGQSNTTGNDNSFFGGFAGNSNTIGIDNSFFGTNSGGASTTASFNSFFGAGAGQANTTGNGNAFFGRNAGDTNTTGDTNTIIGDSADVLSDDLSNATAVGFQAVVGTSNSLVLGRVNGVNGAPSGTNVGIGKVNPSSRLQVINDDGQTGTIRVGNDTVWASGQTRRVVFGDGTFAYIGEEDADDRLVLQGRLGVRFKGLAGAIVGPDADNQLSLGSLTNRWTAVYAANGAIQTSDARLKTNINGLNYGLSQVMQLNPVSFTWKGNSDDRTHLGLLAQDVEKVIPEAIVTSSDPSEPLGMNYSTLVPVLVKAVQEQQKTIEVQQKLIEQLESRLSVIERKLKTKHITHRRR